MPKVTQTQASAIALRVNVAYMTDDYGPEQWGKCARWLAEKCDLDEREIEAVLRSKYMRWAEGYGSGKHNLASFKTFWAYCPTLTTPKAIADLVAGTF